MKHLRLTLTMAAAICCIGTALTGLRAEDKKPLWKPLFDGKTINGWHEFGEKGWWTVENGDIAGPCARNRSCMRSWSATEEYADFTVRLKFKMFDGNSGFYIRTKLVDPDEARGPQVEIAPGGSNFTSGIYESYGRNWLVRPTEAEAMRLFKKNAWNEFIISAKGPHITVRYNGVKTVDFEDPKGRMRGHFVLQRHAGDGEPSNVQRHRDPGRRGRKGGKRPCLAVAQAW